MSDPFQHLSLVGIIEDNFSKGGTVETTVGKQNVFAKVLGNGGKPASARLNHHARNLIRIDDGDAERFEMIGHRRFAAPDAPCNAYHKHAPRLPSPK